MDYVRVGTSNLKVSRLGLGAMGFGAKSWRAWVQDEAEARPILRRAVEHGINFFDTCDFYSAGESERILGKLLAEAGPRESFVIATKAGNPMAPHANARGYSRKHLFAAVEASLQRLGTDYIDLFQTHIWQPDTDLDELVEAFADLVRSGKVLYVGATTMPAWAFTTCVVKSRERRLPAMISMQCEYNAAHREAERELLPFAEANGIGLVPFSPFARGFLSADRRGTTSARTESDDYTHKYYHRPGDFAVYEALAAIAAARGTSPSAIALAWVMTRPGMTAPLFGATRVEQVDDAVAALSLTLAPEEIARISAAYGERPLTSGGH